jgi:hypothetical protein
MHFGQNEEFFKRANILGLLFIWSLYDVITSSEAYLIEQSNHLGNPPLMRRYKKIY